MRRAAIHPIVRFSDEEMVSHRMAIHNAEHIMQVVSVKAPWRLEDLDLIAD